MYSNQHPLILYMHWSLMQASRMGVMATHNLQFTSMRAQCMYSVEHTSSRSVGGRGFVQWLWCCWVWAFDTKQVLVDNARWRSSRLLSNTEMLFSSYSQQRITPGRPHSRFSTSACFESLIWNHWHCVCLKKSRRNHSQLASVCIYTMWSLFKNWQILSQTFTLLTPQPLNKASPINVVRAGDPTPTN